jgi:hypothetical protein
VLHRSMHRSIAAWLLLFAMPRRPDRETSVSSTATHDYTGGIATERKKKIPVVSFFLEPARLNKTMKGAKLLKETSEMLDKIKDKLEPETRRTFEARVEEYVQITLISESSD